ncbi:hypothetical protein SDC9_186782 [bioreactor metagenome]|uniref:Uncharacterized protein n=1 Tax=bioreactor metagenome TaxID=1076179 RepID=A0A645HSX5_9ZZZZ
MRVADGLQPAAMLALAPAEGDGGAPVRSSRRQGQCGFEAPEHGLGAGEQAFQIRGFGHGGRYTSQQTENSSETHAKNPNGRHFNFGAPGCVFEHPTDAGTGAARLPPLSDVRCLPGRATPSGCHACAV